METYQHHHRNRRRRNQLQNRNEQTFEQMRQKQGDRHRLGCQCPTCVAEAIGPACWSCGSSRGPPAPAQVVGYGPVAPGGFPRPGPPQPPPGWPQPHPHQRPRPGRQRGGGNVIIEFSVEDRRMTSEDLLTWYVSTPFRRLEKRDFFETVSTEEPFVRLWDSSDSNLHPGRLHILLV